MDLTKKLLPSTALPTLKYLYSFCRRLVGHTPVIHTVATTEVPASSENRTLIVQPVSQSVYWMSYPGFSSVILTFDMWTLWFTHRCFPSAFSCKYTYRSHEPHVTLILVYCYNFYLAPACASSQHNSWHCSKEAAMPKEYISSSLNASTCAGFTASFQHFFTATVTYVPTQKPTRPCLYASNIEIRSRQVVSFTL